MIYVDPFNIIGKEKEDICYKESFLFFAVAVAGKTASVTSKKINAVLNEVMEGKRGSIFKTIKEKYENNNYKDFLLILQKHKTGKYNTLVRFTKDFINKDINLNNTTVEELESLTGVGKKSSRFYMVYNNASNKDYAVLDTHILRFMKRFGVRTPKNTPTGNHYDRLEKIYLKIYKKSGFRGSLRDFDYAIWETQGNLVLPNSDDFIANAII